MPVTQNTKEGVVVDGKDVAVLASLAEILTEFHSGQDATGYFKWKIAHKDVYVVLIYRGSQIVLIVRWQGVQQGPVNAIQFQDDRVLIFKVARHIEQLVFVAAGSHFY